MHHADRNNRQPGSHERLSADPVHFQVRDTRVLMFTEDVRDTCLDGFGYGVFSINIDSFFAAERT